MRFNKDLDGIAWTGTEVIYNPSLEDLAVSIDAEPIADDILQTAEAWIGYYKRLNEDIVGYDNCYLASLSDYYKAFKEVKFVIENSMPALRKAEAFLDKLRDDFGDTLQTSTRYEKEAGSPHITIVHNYKSPAELRLEQTLPVRNYKQVQFSRIASQPNGEELLKRLFNTNDNPNQMREVFEFISSKPESDIIVDTPSPAVYYTESEHNFIAIGYFGDGLFKVMRAHSGSEGLARGVRL